MRVLLSNSSPEPIYEQIVRQVRAQIIAGELEDRSRRESLQLQHLKRQEGALLQREVITTKRAYEELEKEGLIDTVGGKGTFVAAQNPEFLREKRMKVVEEKLGAAVAEARLLGIGPAELGEMVREFHARRDLVVRRLEETLPGTAYVAPEGAFYLFFNVERWFDDDHPDSLALCQWLIADAEVALVPGAAFGDAMAGPDIHTRRLRAAHQRMRIGAP